MEHWRVICVTGKREERYSSGDFVNNVGILLDVSKDGEHLPKYDCIMGKGQVQIQKNIKGGGEGTIADSSLNSWRVKSP